MKNIRNILVILLSSTALNTWAQSLDSLFHLAVENNLELKTLTLEYEAILSREDQVTQLPNTQVGVGVPVLRPETRLGAQMVMVSAAQMFPWFRSFEAKKDVVIEMSKAKYEALNALKLDLQFELKSAYYQLLFLEKRKNLFTETLQNYQRIEKVVLAKVEANQASLAYALRVQAKTDEYNALLAQIEIQKHHLHAQINKITHQDLSGKILLVDSMDYSFTNYDFEAYRSKIALYHPAIQQISHQISVSESVIAVQEKAKKPSLGIGVDYSIVQARTDANPMYNGRDIFVPKVSLNIPISQKVYNSKIKEERLNQEALGTQKESVIENMLTQIITYKTEYDKARIDFNLSLNQSKKIESAYQILLAKYRADGNNFEELLSTQNELLQLQLKRDLSELTMALAKAKIERLTNY